MAFTEEQLKEMFGEDPEALAFAREINESSKATDKIVEMEKRDHEDFLLAAEEMRKEALLDEAASIDKGLKELDEEEERDRQMEARQKPGSVLPFQKRK